MLLHKLIVLLSDLEHLTSRTYKIPQRGKLIRDYLRIRTKASLNRWFHFREEHFVGFTVDLLNYDIFLAEFRQIFVRNTYYFEPKNATPRIIDGGGNMGMSVLYFSWLAPEASITVFEPSREVFEVLRKNIDRNQLKHVEIVHAGLTEHDGELTMYPRGAAACGNTLQATISEASATHKQNSELPYQVKTVRLSPYLSSPVDLLKLDIEGSEGGVVSELAAANVLGNVRTCVMEYHYYPTAENNGLADLLKRFETASFGTQVYWEDVPHTDHQLDLFRNHSYALSLRMAPLVNASSSDRQG